MANNQDIGQLLRLTASIGSATTDVAGTFDWAAELVCRYSGWPVGHIFTVDPSTGAPGDDTWHLDDPDTFRPLVEATRSLPVATADGILRQVLTGCGPLWLPDVTDDPGCLRAPAARETGVGGALAVPITSSAGVEGVMEFFQRGPAQPDPDLLGFIAHLGTQLGHLLDRRRADRQLRESAARLAEAERVGRAGSWSWDVGTETISWSDELFRIYGVDPTAGPIGFADYLACIHADDRQGVAELIDRILATGEPYESEHRIVRWGDEVRWVHARVAAVAAEGGAVARLTGHSQDVTDRRRAEEARRLSNLELDSHWRILEGIARDDPVVATIEELCRSVESVYGDVRCSVLLVDGAAGVLRHVAAPSLPADFCEAIDGLPVAIGAGACGTAAATNDMVVVADTLADPLTEEFAALARRHGLHSVWSQPLRAADGEVLGTFALYRCSPHKPDELEVRTVRTSANLVALAMERSRTRRALVSAATVDPLTGLANRNHFVEGLTAEIGRGAPVAVLFLDLDRFTWINDSLGHPAGDRILQEVGARLRAAVGDRHHVGRFGGDEFTVLLVATAAEEVDTVAESIQRVIAEPFILDGGEFFLSCSVGIALGDGTSTADGLIRDADAALFAAKENGRARRAMFDETLRTRAIRRLTLGSQLRRAIDRDEFEMHYQPIVDLRTAAWVGVEALVRWRHPERGLVGPDQFIPLAEEDGLIVPLGEQILAKVVADRRSWNATDDLYAAVNLSVVQLADVSLGATVRAAVTSAGLPPHQMVVEVTETAVMLQLATAREALEEIRDAGIRVLIDDFGTGYSSIARLGQLPITGLKIDNSFTAALGRDRQAGEIVASITGLAHALGLQVIAEGIESPEAAGAARQLGCDFGQGYHFARPQPAAVISDLLARRR